MVLERLIWKVSHLHHQEFIELLEASLAAQGWTFRVCSYLFGDRDTVSADIEFKSVADMEQNIADFDHDRPEFVAFHQRYPDLAETGVTRELLQVH